MIVMIRIRGLVGINKDIEATLERLRLKKKFSCVLVREKPEFLGMIKKVRQHTAYGKIDFGTLKALMEKRARMPGEKHVKVDDKMINDLIEGKITLSSLNIKPFFRLHPPRGGFKKSTSLLYPRGVLGENKEISKLILNML